MSRAQRGTNAAPFERARAGGYVFRSRALRRAFEAFLSEQRRANGPIIIVGPAGLGKKTILLDFLADRSGTETLAASLGAGAFTDGPIAEDVLAAFGQQPVDDASAALALQDFIEDCTAAGQLPILAVADLEKATPDQRAELSRLARPVDRAGAGLVLLASASDETAARELSREPVRLPLLEADEIKALVEQVFRTVGLDLPISDDALRALGKLSGGVLGRLGSLLDRSVERCLDDQGACVELRHVTGRAPLRDAPSPAEIEAALLVIGDAEEPAHAAGDFDIDEAFDALRHEKARTYRPMSSASFPRISAGQPFLPQEGPANDTRAPLDPRIVLAMEEVARELAALREKMATVREETVHLRQRADTRADSMGEAAERFVNSLRKPDPDAGGE